MSACATGQGAFVADRSLATTSQPLSASTEISRSDIGLLAVSGNAMLPGALGLQIAQQATRPVETLGGAPLPVAALSVLSGAQAGGPLATASIGGGALAKVELDPGAAVGLATPAASVSVGGASLVAVSLAGQPLAMVGGGAASLLSPVASVGGGSLTSTLRSTAVSVASASLVSGVASTVASGPKTGASLKMGPPGSMPLTVLLGALPTGVGLGVVVR